MKNAISRFENNSIKLSVCNELENKYSYCQNEKMIPVLHLDDDSNILQVSKEVLQLQNDFEVDTVTSVTEAIERITKQKYDVIVSDYEMPIKDGLHFLKEIREQLIDIPFIMFTGKGREEVVIKALNLGADGYVNKQGDVETVYSELTHNIRTTVKKVRAERALKDSEAKYAAFMRQARDGVLIIQDQKLEFVNEALARILGYSLCEIEKKPFITFVASESRDLIIQRVNARMAGLAVPSFYEAKLLRKDGTEIEVELSGNVIQYGGKPADFGIVRDITERKKAEEKIRISEEQYRTLFEQAIDVIYTHDLEGRITTVNRAIEKYGFRRDEVIGKNVLDLVPKKYWVKLMSQIKQIKAGESFEGEIEVNTPLGIKRAEYKSSPIRLREKIIGAQAIIRDITESKKAEQNLKKSEEKYRNIFELCPDGIMTVSMSGTILSINKSFLDKTGFSEEEIVGKNFLQVGVLQAKDLPKYAKLFSSIIRGKNPEIFEFAFNRKDKTQGFGEAHIRVMQEKGKKTGIQAILRDITDYKKSTREAIEQERKLSSLLENSLLAIWHLDLHGKVILVNQEACRRMGGKAEDSIGKEISDIYPKEMASLTKKRFEEVRRSGENRIYEDRVEFPFGEKWFRSVYQRIINEDGIMVGLQILSDDISDKKQIEQALIKTSEELRAESEKLRLLNEKLEVVGKLTRHDLRNKLASMKCYVYLLNKKIGEDVELKSYLTQIASIFTSTEKLLTFSNVFENIGSDQSRIISVGSCFGKALSLFPELQKIKIENKCQNLEVLADSQLEQLFYNLIDDSLRHGQKTSHIRLHYTQKSNGLEIIYQDNGVGIPEANKSKLFSEGFTTGKGSGYGLSLIKRIIQVYGWTIKEEGNPGKGVKFIIFVPKAP
jgi:PAS domain S-box-containing protein